jgi:GrpB-like predicted nucleotidyltransferase (UPF0157 family)
MQCPQRVATAEEAQRPAGNNRPESAGHQRTLRREAVSSRLGDLLDKRTIEIAPFSPLWAGMFAHEQKALAGLLGPDARIHHIGSTAVWGLAAKPVIDILVEVPYVERLDSHTRAFRELGYESRGENGIPGRRYFVKGLSERTHQVHAFRTGSHDVRRHLALRDFLRANDEIRDAYAVVKHHAVAECGNDIHAYVALKNDFVRLLEAQALADYRDV